MIAVCTFAIEAIVGCCQTKQAMLCYMCQCTSHIAVGVFISVYQQHVLLFRY